MQEKRPRSRARAASVVAVVVSALSSADLPVGADVLGSLTRPISGRPRRASSGRFDPESNRDAHHVRSGQRFVLADLEGPGEVRHIWFTIAGLDRRYPRNLVLRVFYDGSSHPSVEAPIGDFFAAGNGMRANVSTLPIEVSSYGRALNSYWRMPFRKRCLIEVHNQGPHTLTVYFQCDWLELDSLAPDVRYFHARYRQERPAREFSWYTVFEGEGEGHYVGTVFSSQNNVASWFGEADDRIYVDGESVPSIIGTGTEDYFNDAWNLRLTSNRRVGTTICEPKGLERRITAYRWHIDDPIPFTRSLKLEIERRSFIAVTDPETGRRKSYDFKYRPDHWSSVAFWYQKGIAKVKWPFPPAEQRLLPEVWIEPSRLVDKCRTSPGLKPKRLYNRTCNLKRFFYVRNDEVGSWVEFPVTIDEAGRYAVSVFQNCYKHYGVWKVILRGADGETVLHAGLDSHDYRLGRAENWPENFEHGTTMEKKLGVHRIGPGDYWVRFECTGANPQSRHPETGEFGKGMSLGLDAVNFRRLPIDDPWAWAQEYLRKEKALFARMDSEAARTVKALSDGMTKLRRADGTWPKTLDALSKRIPLDPWKQRYRYRSPGVVRPWAFDLYSLHGRGRRPSAWIGNWTSPLELNREVPPGGLVFEGEALEAVGKSDGVGAAVQRVSSYGNAPVSGGAIQFITLKKPGDRVELALPDKVPPGRYRTYLHTLTSWDYGICRWSLAGVPLGGPIDGHTQTIGVASAGGPVVEIGKGRAVLRVEAVGKASRSTGYRAGLDALVLIPAGAEAVAKPVDFEKASRHVPKPREVWPHVKKHVVPLEFRVTSDEIVVSDTDPSKKLRKVTAHFYSQQLAGRKWGHPCVIFTPADNRRNLTGERKGKVVIIGSPPRGYFPVHVAKYGEPIAARTGYPTMVLSNPGTYADGSDIESDIRILSTLRRQTGKNYYNMNCQLAVVYIQAINALQEFLGLDSLKAVVGGHSKRGRSATVAAAIDPRVVSPIIMGNEGVHRTDRIQWHLSFHHAFFQDQVNVPVFYLGATNEDGYRMFNVNLLQQRLRRPMTVEMIPNYCHSNFSEIQFMDFLMWVSHIHDGRPVTRIADVSHERTDGRTIFRARLDGHAKVQVVKAWYVYTDDAAWRDLMWYHLLMRRTGDHWEAVLHGKMPDAFMIEVGDVAMGVAGYVSSTPRKLTDAVVIERRSRGSRPRLWQPM